MQKKYTTLCMFLYERYETRVFSEALTIQRFEAQHDAFIHFKQEFHCYFCEYQL